MELIAIVTALAALQVFVFGFLVGRERARHGVAAPAMTGHPAVERAIRVQENTVELLVVFLPGLWLFGYYINATIGAAIGVVFLVGRLMFRAGYMAEPKKRAPGFLLSALSTVVLVVGGLVGAVLNLL